MMPVAADSIRHWVDWADVRSRRMRWWEILPTEKVVEALQQRGAELPVLKPLDVLLRVTAEIGARYTAFSGCGLNV